jgi:iron complex outermembrane receptor protein
MPLNLRGSMEYLHARYTNYKNAGNNTSTSCADFAGTPDNPATPNVNEYKPPALSTTCTDAGGGNTTVIGNWTGRRLLRAPDWSATIGADYTLENVFGGKLVTSLTAQYSSRYAPQKADYLCTYYKAVDLNTTPANLVPINQREGDTPGQNYCDPGKGKGRYEEKGWAQLNAQINWTDASEHFTIGLFGNNINNVHYLLAYSTPGYGKNVLYNEPRTFGVRAGVKF